MSKRLNVLISDDLVGHVERKADGKLIFRYLDAWREGGKQIPLSLKMPLAAGEYPDKIISRWMWNLLPDNEQVLERWARQFQCSPRNVFALLENVGEDCAGAVQFLTDERLANPPQNKVRWLAETEIEERLAALRQDAAAGRKREDHGQFSLAGAQAKTAYLYDEVTRSWGIPEGRLPTTHILKPPIPTFAGHSENEVFCLRLAQEAGMSAANAKIIMFGVEKAIVIERYDRFVEQGEFYRIHQEDMCQALAVHPSDKYENQGGPGIVKIMNEVLSRSAAPRVDKARFVQAAIFNFLIGGTDAHGKNFSMLIGEFGEALMAPLYDISSILPHLKAGEVDADPRDIKMAMRVGDKYLMSDIYPRHWERLAQACDFDPDYTMALLRHHIATLPEQASAVAQGCRRDGLDHPVLDQLVDLIAQRTDGLREFYGSEPMPAKSLPYPGEA